MRRLATIVGTIALLVVTSPAVGDVLYKSGKAIALGKGQEEKGKGVIHWTYCDGKTEDYKRPPHDFVTGEHCKIQPELFGLIQRDNKYFVEDKKAFGNFFSGASTGEEVGFKADTSMIKMQYKGESRTLQYSGRGGFRNKQPY
jgi:hypothetical protein